MKDPSYAPVYCALYPKLAKIARSHGYALAIHGTLGRDMDLICVPWADKISRPIDVVDEITSTFAIRRIGEPTAKNHGREAWTISVGHGECAIDLSFVATAEQYGLHASGWVASADVWEALDALLKGETRNIDGKAFRWATGTTSEDKLFEVVNRPCGLQQLFNLPDAVRFALKGELVPRPALMDVGKPTKCPQCGAITRRVGSSPSALDHCTACMLDMCATCLGEHHKKHDADPRYRLLPTPEQLELEREELGMAAAIVAGLGPIAAATLHGHRNATESPRPKTRPSATKRRPRIGPGQLGLEETSQ